MWRDNPLARSAPVPEKQWPLLGRLSVLAGFWLFIGFALGTVFLLGPVRWWASLCRAKNWAQGIENGGVLAIIVLLVLVSFLLSYGAMRAFARSKGILVRALLVLLALGAGGAAYWKWINPTTMKGNMGAEQAAGVHFTIGPYPDTAKLAELRAQGYTAVISLLHPAVVPFEPQLIAKEQEAAARVGIELIHLPMLPWVSENTESLDRLRAIAASKQGRYYVHCYLGVDRVNIARRIIEQATAGEAVVEGGGAATRRSLDAQMKIGFERGPIVKLEEGLYLIPYPTDEEFSGFILGGGVQTVIALLDPADAQEKVRIDHETTLLRNHSLPFTLVEVGAARFDGRKIIEALALARTLRRPIVIQPFFTSGGQRAAVSEGVRIAHRSGLPPLPPSMWATPMAGGQPEVIAPHIAIGPRPTGSELYQVLAARGVRIAVLVGGVSAKDSVDASAAAAADIELRSVAAEPAQLLTLVESGGPYYLYGRGVESVKAAVLEKYAALMEPAPPSRDSPAAPP